MPFKKGRKKTGGRKKGTPNRATAEFKLAVEAFVIDNLPHFVEIMNDAELSPKDKAAIYVKLFEYVLPKQSAVQLDTAEKIDAVKVEIKTTGVKPLTDEQ